MLKKKKDRKSTIKVQAENKLIEFERQQLSEAIEKLSEISGEKDKIWVSYLKLAKLKKLNF